MKRLSLALALTTLLFSSAKAASVFKIFDQSGPGMVKLNGGKAQGLRQGTVLIAYDEKRTLGWVTLLEVGEVASVAKVTYEEAPGLVHPGVFLSMGPRPLARPGKPGTPERSDAEKSPPAWKTTRELPEASLGEPLDALGLLRRAIDMDPKNPERYQNYADALMLQRRYEEAVDVLKKAVRVFPEGPQTIRLLQMLAASHRALGHEDIAQRYERFLHEDHEVLALRPMEETPVAMTGHRTKPVARNPKMGEPFRAPTDLPVTMEPLPDDWTFEDPFGKPLPAPEQAKHQGGRFNLSQVLVEGHDSKDAPDDFSYQLYAFGKTLGPKHVLSALLMNRVNLSEGERDAWFGGLNLTTRMGKGSAFLSGVYTDYSGKQSGAAGDGEARITAGLSQPWKLSAKTQLIGDVRYTFASGDVDDTWDGKLTLKQAVSTNGAVELGYAYTYDVDLNDSFQSELSLAYGQKIGRRGRLRLEATQSEPLFDVAATSAKPAKDTIWRLSYTRVGP